MENESVYEGYNSLETPSTPEVEVDTVVEIEPTVPMEDTSELENDNPEVEQPTKEESKEEESTELTEDDKVEFKSNRISKRFNKLTKSLKEQQEQLDERNKLIQEYETRIAQMQVPPNTEESKDVPNTHEIPSSLDSDEPQLEKFETFAEYQKALMKHEAQKLFEAEREKTTRQNQIQSIQESARVRTQEYIKDNPTFVTDLQMAAKEINTLSLPVRQALMISEHGPAITHEAATNPDVLNKLKSVKNHYDVGRIIGSLESKHSNKKTEPKVVDKKVSEAPKPVSTPKGSSSAKKNWYELTGKDYLEYMNKVKAKQTF